MKIAAYTVGDINVASSRLRSFYLFYFSSNHGVNVLRGLTIWQSLQCEYLHLQSCYVPRYVLQAVLFRLLGRRVFFDVCDIPTRKIHFAFLVLTAMIANTVTVPLDTTRTYLSKYVAARKIVVISDVIDVAPNKVGKLAFVRNVGSKGIFWTGHPGNLDSIEEFIKIIRFHEEYKLIVLTRLSEIGRFIQSYPWVTFLDWSLDSAFDCKIDIGYALLNHAADSAALYKCENKMVLSIALGLIPIVSRTPAYEALAKQLGADRLVFDDLAEVLNVIENMDPRWATEFLSRAKSYVFAHYSSDHVFLVFLSKCLLAH